MAEPHRARARAGGEVWSPEEIAAIEGVRDKLFARFGKEAGLLMAEQSRSILVFPNLLFQDSGTGFRCRQIEPVEPGLSEVRQWEFAPREEPLLLRRRRLEGARAFLGPGGFASPDDVEAVESCQLGFRNRRSRVVRHLARHRVASVTKDTDEHQIRNFWREWQTQLDRPRAAVVLGAAS